MQKSGKLELTWVGKYEQQSVEPRILLEDKSKSYGDTDSGNMLIHGDNLIALKALEQDFTGKVKCIYIDPPYNIDVANPHYEDGLPHSEWLNIMRSRLEILKNLLHPEGSIWISINSDELFFLKLLCDEVFIDKNFISMITLKTATTASYRAINVCPVNVSEYILVYAKNAQRANFTPVYIPVDYSEDYGSYIENINDAPENWALKKLDDLIYEEVGVANWREFREKYGDAWKDIRYSMKREKALLLADCLVSLNTLQKPANEVARLIELSKEEREKFFIHERDGKDPIIIYNGRTLAFYSAKLRTIGGTLTPSDILTNIWNDISYLSLGLEGAVKFPNSKKPERLIQRILEIVTTSGDLVLDSFLGSGTTAAVAHKMGRRWIGIELGDHAYTHCKVRLDKVVDGEQGGISKSMNWQGGGGYKFYELAPSLLEKHPILPVYQINKEYTFEMLCEAICKLEGFMYMPEGEMHGHSSENRFIHITKDYVSGDYISQLMKEVGENQSVLIYSAKIQSGLRLPDNVEVKRIPKDLLSKCSFESEVR